MPIYAAHNFMPVGQGLFATGAVGTGSPAPGFRWVYDCGTLSRREFMTRSMNALEEEVRTYIGAAEKPRIDLVVISHFDGDHLNGLAELLTRFRVDTLMLPFTHLEHRLIAMFSSRQYTSKANQRFAVDPIGTIASLPDTDIGRIVLVPPSGPEAAPAPVQNNDQPPVLPDDEQDARPDEPTLKFDESEPTTADGRSELEAAREAVQHARGRPIALQYMRQNSVARHLGIWEFVPYNDPSTLWGADAAFLSAVKAKRRKLLASSSLEDRRISVAELKVLFDKRFGKSGKLRNLISLFLYSGPIARISHSAKLANAPVGQVPWRCVWHCPLCWPYGRKGGDIDVDQPFRRTGFLYTGDGFLETPARWEALEKFLGPARLNGLFGVQVMHHGSRHNWYPAIARTISPKVSVFSSDPLRGKRPKAEDRRPQMHHPHPHPEVWEGFKPFYRSQADTFNGVHTLTEYQP